MIDDKKYAKVELDKNPHGTERKMMEQREREKSGRYVKVDNKTMIFVRDGEDAEKKVTAHLERMKKRQVMWN